MEVNLVDEVWSKLRPCPPNSDLRILVEEYCGKLLIVLVLFSVHNDRAGKSWQKKVESVRKAMKEKGASILIVTALDEVACEYCTLYPVLLYPVLLYPLCHFIFP